MTAPASMVRPAAAARLPARHRCRKWRHKARIGLQMPNGIGLSLQWRYIGKVEAETLADNETLHGAFPLDPGLHIKAFNYFDLASTFTVGDHYNFRLGVNNIFDKHPPMVHGRQRGPGRLEPVPDRSVQRQHLSGHLGRARPLHLRGRDADF